MRSLRKEVQIVVGEQAPQERRGPSRTARTLSSRNVPRSRAASAGFAGQSRGSVPVLAALSAAVLWLTRWPVEWALLAADVVFLAVVPLMFRYSRVIWILLDRTLVPDGNN